MSVFVATPDTLSSDLSLSDRDWRKILRDIHDGKVIPAIGLEDFTDLRVRLALAEAAQATFKEDANFTPPLSPEVRDAFRAHLIKTAPQSRKEAVFTDN